MPILACGQMTTSSFLTTENGTNRIHTYHNAGLYGKGLTNQFLSAVYNGNFIDADLKSTTLDGLGQINYMAGSMTNGLALKTRFHKSDTGFTIDGLFAVENQELAVMQFGKNFMDLALNGNYKFAGDTLSIENTSLTFRRLQKLSAGLVFSKGKVSQLGVSIDLYKGEQFADFSATNNWLYTSQMGDTLALSTNSSFVRSDTAKSAVGLDKFNGTGAGVSFYYQIPFNDDSLSGGFLMLEVRNLGFVSWRSTSLSTAIDTTLMFTGVEINTNDFSVGTSALDSSKTIVEDHTQQKRITTATPASVGLYVHDIINKKMDYTLGIHYRLSVNHRPFVFYKHRYHFAEAISGQAQIGYGGFGTYWFGAGLSGKFGPINYNLGTQNILGFIFNKQVAGIDAYLTLSYQL